MTIAEIKIRRAFSIDESKLSVRIDSLFESLSTLEKKLIEDTTGEIEKIKEEYLLKLEELENVFNEKLSKISLTPGEKGDAGKTPIKNKDYFDGKAGITPEKGKDYFTKKEIKEFKKEVTPVKGVDYHDGLNGYNPIKGIDYHDGKNGSPDKPLDIANKLNTLKERVDMKVVIGLEKRIEEILVMIKDRRGKQSGGGDSVEAGTGITITRTAGGKRRISATSTGISILTPTSGVADESNQTFEFTTAPTILYVDNKALQKVSSDGEVNWTGTTTVVLTIAPNRDIYGLG